MEKIVLDNTNQELLLYVCNYFNNISGDFVTNYFQYISRFLVTDYTKCCNNCIQSLHIRSCNYISCRLDVVTPM